MSQHYYEELSQFLPTVDVEGPANFVTTADPASYAVDQDLLMGVSHLLSN